MNRIIILDEQDNHYKTRELLSKIDNILVTHAESLDELRLRFYELDPDLVIYNKDILNISIHDILAFLLDSDYTSVPIALFSKLPQHIQLHEHEQLFGPFQIDSDSTTLISIINMLLKHKKAFQQSKLLKEENQQLKHGVLSRQEETLFKDVSFFKVRVMQEIKKARRFNHPLSLAILSFDTNDLILNHGPKVVNKFTNMVFQSVKNTVRDTDIPMNYGENQLLILMPNTDDVGLENAIQRLSGNILKIEHKDKGVLLKANFKFGTSIMGKTSETFSEMVKEALKQINS